MLLTGCQSDESSDARLPAAVVGEAFLTSPEHGSNLDSPAVWLGPGGEAWVVTTGKSSDRLHVHEAASGAPVGWAGRRGTGPGEFRRPNGIAIFDDLLLVVERDNARVQALRLPGFEPVATFGRAELRRPYGIAVLEQDEGRAIVFVTDDYRTPSGRDPPDRELDQRVKRYRIADDGAGVTVSYLGAFGDTAGPGRLRKVESLAVDPDARTLLVADESAVDVKVYGVDGGFTGRVLWRGVIRHEPEGIVLYACGATDGYWIVADQHPDQNRFLVFDRRSFEPVGVFAGATIRHTDGLALTPRSVGSMEAGAVYAVHADIALGAFSWTEVARALGLRENCADRHAARPDSLEARTGGRMRR